MNTFLINDELLMAEPIESRWINSPFLDLKLMPPKQKGMRFELIVKDILKQLGENVSDRTSTDHDFCVDSYSYEMKGSTTTKDKPSDHYSFLQIRPDQEYDYLLFAAFCHDGTIELYRFSKKDVVRLIDGDVFKKQHGGKKAESRTFSYNGSTKNLKNFLWYKGKYVSGKKTPKTNK